MSEEGTRLRQVAWVARDLNTTTTDVQRRLGLEVCFSDPGVATFGLENVLFPVGDQFLEIVSPTTDGTTAGRLLDKRSAGASAAIEAAGYMVIFQTAGDLDDVRTRAEQLDVRIVFEAPGGSAADGTSIHGIHFHPADVGGAIVSIDRSEQPAEWAWAGPTWRDHVRTDVVDALSGVQIEVDDPVASAERWAALLGVEASATDVAVDDAVIRFTAPDDTTPARGVVGLSFAGAADAEFELLGTTVRIFGSTAAD